MIPVNLLDEGFHIAGFITLGGADGGMPGQILSPAQAQAPDPDADAAMAMALARKHCLPETMLVGGLGAASEPMLGIALPEP